MYESFFQLTARPFSAGTDPLAYVPCESMENARRALTRCIQRDEGAALVIGTAGSGKSLLCRLVERDLQGEMQIVRMRGGDVTSRRSLFQAILRGLGLPYRLNEGELRLSLVDYIEHGATNQAGILILVDEAQSLPISLLEELRQLTNLQRDDRSWVRLALFGGTELEERFASPKLESFSQRLAVRCYLQPLGRQETGDYVTQRIGTCGGRAAEIFTDEALVQIYNATDGVPRKINQLCDHAMVLAFAGGKKPIAATDIEEAWADLQQLPIPVSRVLPVGDEPAPESIVEFGDLEDEEEPQRMFVPPQMPAASAETTISANSNLTRIEAHLGRLEQEYRTKPAAAQGVRFAFQPPQSKPSDSFEQEEVLVDRYAQRKSTPTPVPRGISEQAAGQWPPLPSMLTENLHSPPVAHGPVPGAISMADNDDDMIVVEDDAETLPMHAAPRPAVRRREYGQLFAKLRRG